MDQKTESHSQDHAGPVADMPTAFDLSDPTPAPIVQTEADSGPAPFILNIVNSDDNSECRFWIGLASKGPLPPGSLMDMPQVENLLKEAAVSGVTDDPPLMLSNASVTPPRYVYLLPQPSTDFRLRTEWIRNLVSTVQSWAPEAAGLYIAPEVTPQGDAQELIQEIVRELILTGGTREFFLLTGTYGINPLINLTIRLKAELASDQIDVLIFH